MLANTAHDEEVASLGDVEEPHVRTFPTSRSDPQLEEALACDGEFLDAGRWALDLKGSIDCLRARREVAQLVAGQAVDELVCLRGCGVDIDP